jgi:hypothetical protein
MSNKKIRIGFLILILFIGFFGQITEIPHIVKEKEFSVNLSLLNDEVLVNDLNITFDFQGGGTRESAHSLAIDTAGNMYIVGRVLYFPSPTKIDIDVCLIKYNGSGAFKYAKQWGDEDTEEVGNAIALDHLGNIFIAGTSERNAFLIKYDNNGLFQWNKTWIRSSFNAIAVDSLGYVYLTGRSGEESNSDVYLVKCDNYGEQEWSRTWDTTSGSHEAGEAIALDTIGNIYIVGTSNNDAFLLKCDNTGSQTWRKIWSGAGEDFGTSIAIDLHGKLYIAGSTSSYNAGLRDLFLAKCDSNGVQEWYRTWGSIGQDYNGKVALDTSGNIYLLGITESYGGEFSRICLVKFDNSGNLQWDRIWTLTQEEEDITGDINVDRDGNIYIVGGTQKGVGDIFLTKFGIDFDRDGLSDWQEINVYSTDPYSIDTDEDRLTDYAEIITHLTNPNNADTDGDNLSDYEEIILCSTDPNNIDSDGDGFDDGIEVSSGFDPNDSANSPFILIIVIMIITIIVISVLISVSIYLYLRYKKIKIKKAPARIGEKEIEKEESKSLYVRATQEEVSISTEKKICLVCKNELSRGNYICPECNAFYCENCVKVLSNSENACWVCNAPFDPSKPSKPFEKEGEEIEVEKGALKKEDVDKV